jgi:acetyl/propionyl-CoA carboxylase alpha subunit
LDPDHKQTHVKLEREMLTLCSRAGDSILVLYDFDSLIWRTSHNFQLRVASASVESCRFSIRVANFISVSSFPNLQAQLGDIVFVDVQAGQDESVTKGSPFAVVESVKSASEVYAPVSGTVVEVNGALSDSPETVSNVLIETCRYCLKSVLGCLSSLSHRCHASLIFAQVQG